MATVTASKEARQAAGSGEITAHELKRLLDEGEDVLVLDVREPDEFEDWRIPEAVNVPLGRIQAGDPIPAEDDQPVVTLCASGQRSAMAQQVLTARGHDVRNLRDGMMGWNHVYDVVGLDASTPEVQVRVLQFQRTGKGCLSYMIVSDAEALVIDASRDIEIYTEAAQEHGAEIVATVDTHAHADHVSGGPLLADELGIPYHLHPYDAIHPIDMVPATVAYEPLADGDELTLGRATLQVLHVPGHTLGNIALLLGDAYLFTGDTIFIDSIARPDLGGQAEAWTPLHQESLQRMLALPDETLVLPGHFASPNEAREDGLVGATVARLQAENHGVRMALGDPDSFEAYILSSLPDFPEAYVEIKRVNAGLRHPGKAGIDDLEFGKQECALSD